MDELGVTQHHDGVTGTSRQRVAWDYISRLYNGINKNNKVYRKQIGKITNSVTKDDWKQCLKTNTTYIDCPSANFNKNNKNLSIIVHNPSTFDIS
jgi:hypothetical protein